MRAAWDQTLAAEDPCPLICFLKDTFVLRFSRVPLQSMMTSLETGHHGVVDGTQSGSSSVCVDVLIAARDRSDTIERAVLSALAQDKVRRVIVIDDGSIDDTAARARHCNEGGERVIVKSLHSSLGPAAARNVAIGISTAPWIAILDADDFFVPGRIGVLLTHSAGWDLVADDVMHVAQEQVAQTSWSPTSFATAAGKSLQLTFADFVRSNVTRRGRHRKELGYLQPLIRRQFLDSHALRYDESLRFGEDFAFCARALAAGARFLLLPAPGYVAVERPDSLSARHTKRDLELLRDSDRALLAMSHLTVDERQAVLKHDADLDRRAQWLVLVEALQSHDYAQALSTFFRSRALTLYLIERMITEVPLQIRKRLKRLCYR